MTLPQKSPAFQPASSKQTPGRLRVLLLAAAATAATACSSAPASPSTTPNPSEELGNTPGTVPVPAGQITAAPGAGPGSAETPSSVDGVGSAFVGGTTAGSWPGVADATRPSGAPAPSNVTGCARSVLVAVDRSGSMSGLPIAMAMKGAQQIADRLSSSDCYGLMIFDSVPTRVVTMARLIDPHREAVKEGIKKVQAGGGTEIRTAMQMALEDMRAVTSSSSSSKNRRFIIFVTDGQSPRDGALALASAMGQESITLTTVGLGEGTDEPFLRTLASNGNGRFYKVRDIESLPKLLDKEAQLITSTK